MRQELLSRKVDHAALKTNQVFIIGFLLLAFVLNNIWLAAFVGIVMLLGTVAPSLALFQQIYKKGLRPAGLVKPDVQIDNPEPHRFAQGFGGVVVLLAVAAWLLPAATLSWALVWLVILLAALNLFAGFCAGCFLYYQLNRLGVPGFHVNRIPRG